MNHECVPMKTPLKFVQVPLPEWSAYEAEVARLLDVEPGERTTMRGTTCAVYLPEVLWADYSTLVDKLTSGDWTLGRFLGYLVVKGAASLVQPAPIPLVIHCPSCRTQHVDEGEWTTRVHRTHKCAGCGRLFRPSLLPTVGVKMHQTA